MTPAARPPEEIAAPYLAARDAMLRLRALDSHEARQLVGVLHHLLDGTDGWSHAAMVAATARAEALLRAAR